MYDLVTGRNLRFPVGAVAERVHLDSSGRRVDDPVLRHTVTREQPLLLPRSVAAVEGDSTSTTMSGACRVTACGRTR